MRLSGLVVTYNEESRLEECLRSLSFCRQLLVVDLGSEDRSVEIATRLASRVVHHGWKPFVEAVLPGVLDELETDWFVRADPDEVFPGGLSHDIEQSLANTPEAGIMQIPFLYYYLGEPLTTTVWGGVRHFPRVLNRNRIILPEGVHGPFGTKEGFCTTWIQPTDDNVVRHYWIDEHAQLGEKHRRYLAVEGQSMFARGGRFSWWGMARAAISGLGDSLLLKNGWRGGWAGWYLSFFFAQYVARAWLSLRRYQHSLGLR